jgi:hypothetical protein
MPEILRVFTIARFLFGPDTIPWSYVLLESNMERLRERYRLKPFAQVADAQGNVALVASGAGEFVSGESRQAIEQLSLEPTALQFQISATSKEADSFLGDLSLFLRDIDPNARFDLSRQYTRTYQSIAIVRLDVAYEELLSPRLRRFLENTAPSALALPDAPADISLQHLSWAVRYRTQRTEWFYLPKVLTLEPRAGSKPEEKIYYTQSPTDFETHLKLLVSFEQQFKQENAPWIRRVSGRKKPRTKLKNPTAAVTSKR